MEVSSGHDTLTMSAPASSKDCIWFIVPLISVVKVLVIDWTLIGELPPTLKLPTLISLVIFLFIILCGLTSILI